MHHHFRREGTPRRTLPEMPERGVIKWFDGARRIGFLTTPNGSDVFLHFSVLVKSGIAERDMEPGRTVRFASKRVEGKRNAEVTALAII